MLAWAYTHYGTTPTGSGVLYGVGPVVVALVAAALWGLAGSAMKQRWFIVIFAVSIAAYFNGLNILVPLLTGGLVVSLVANRDRLGGTGVILPFAPLLPTLATPRLRPRVFDVLAEFTKLGFVVFGSGYVLLAFLRADLVDHLHWLTQRQVLDAVAAGQITPGPVFTTATFVGYLLGGLPLALVATAGIFLPSFVMVALVAPIVVRIRRSRWLAPALDGITIAALGLMAGVTFDLARTAITDPLTMIIGIAALAALLRWRPNAIWLVAAGTCIGLAHAAIT
jgi:chromate transporter